MVLLFVVYLQYNKLKLYTMSLKTKAFLPIGTRETNTTKLISKGDILKLITGEEVIFMEMKRTKFVALMDGKATNVPIWRDRNGTKPFIEEVIGKDESVITKTAKVLDFMPGQLFALEGKKESYMFKHIEQKRNKQVVIGVELSSGTEYTIDMNFTFVKIDTSKMMENL